MADNTTTLAFIGVIGTVITALFKLLNDNTKALNRLVTSSEKVALATQKAAKEAKERNGHLGEQSIKLAEALNTQNAEIHTISKTLQSSATTLAQTEADKKSALKEVKVTLENK